MITAQPASITANHNRKLLGTFLRTRRESLDPNRLGLPRMRHRRTPGLRREEVAQLADVGVTWYTWLEQGRDIKASPKTLTAIATALQCNDVETQHLFSLAGHILPSVREVAACCKIAEHNQQMLDAIQLPAIIETPRFDILGYNAAWCKLMGVQMAEIPLEDRNCIWLACCHGGLGRSDAANGGDVSRTNGRASWRSPLGKFSCPPARQLRRVWPDLAAL